jgi:hypothetical protein
VRCPSGPSQPGSPCTTSLCHRHFTMILPPHPGQRNGRHCAPRNLSPPTINLTPSFAKPFYSPPNLNSGKFPRGLSLSGPSSPGNSLCTSLLCHRHLTTPLSLHPGPRNSQRLTPGGFPYTINLTPHLPPHRQILTKLLAPTSPNPRQTSHQLPSPLCPPFGTWR